MQYVIILLLFYGSQRYCWAGPLYRYPTADRDAVQALIRLGGEPVCGSRIDSLLLEFPNPFSAQAALREYPALSIIADSPFDLYGSGPVDTVDEVNEYRTFSLVQAELTNYAQLYPLIARIDTIGYSVNHFPLLRLRISDSVVVQRDIPSILLLGGTHGNEAIGVEVVMEYLAWLFSRVNTDTSLQRRLQQVELHVIPVFNPDGYINGIRHNAHNVDLNRNFRFHWGYAAVNYGSAPLSEPENYALDSLLRVIQPVTSISYHSYGELILRPYSWNSREAPDSTVTRSVANLYRNTITRYQSILGGQLYYHGGEFNDHTISTFGTTGITVEVWRGPNYNPPSDSIANVCMIHRAGINAVLDRAAGGQFVGTIRDHATGEPIGNATWELSSHWDTGYLPRIVMQGSGRFRMLREPGTITMQISAPEYQSRTVTLPIVSANAPTYQDIDLVTSYSAIRGVFALFGHDSTDSVFAQCQDQRIAIDSSVTFYLTHLTAGLDTFSVAGVLFETNRRPVILMPGDTLGVLGFTVKRLPPVLSEHGMNGNDLFFSWNPPYLNQEARTMIRGYSIEKNHEEYVPLTFDTTYSEPFLPGASDAVFRVRTIYHSWEASSFTDTIYFTRSSEFSEHETPGQFGIGSPYPNPCNNQLNVPYHLAQNQEMDITIYDVTGREVTRDRVTGSTLGVWVWKPQPIQASSGIYFLHWKLESTQGHTKFVFLR
ncbi:MAG: DUF2817 domain-containing protein [bacterium]|nr:DUF2817 domain-containing protein [bacterium]